MKKVICTGVLAMIAAAGALLLTSDKSASAYVEYPPGTYQCADCGVIEKVTSRGTVLNERGWDGHVHDWRYIGGLSGTIHPIR